MILEKALITDIAKKLTIDGKTSSFIVYKIPLYELNYNDKNDRISTIVERYVSENSSIDKLDQYHFNNLIEEFIEESDISGLKRTKDNIKMYGQREPGVVLSDGTVIDGNRRFTCLRQLYNETNDESFKYFEAAVLTDVTKEDVKTLKSLELQIQHGYEGKVGYNPIERLAGIYKYIIKDNIFTIEEYAKHINMKLSNLSKLVSQVYVILDFLKFIDMPNKFYVAKELGIDGPTIEISNFYRKHKDIENKLDISEILFNHIIVKPDSDITRHVRKIVSNKNKNQTVFNNDFIEGHKVFNKEINQYFKKFGTIKAIKALQVDNDLKIRMLTYLQEYINKGNTTNEKEKYVKQINSALRSIEIIDPKIYDMLPNKIKNKCNIKLKKVNELINRLIE